MINRREAVKKAIQGAALAAVAGAVVAVGQEDPAQFKEVVNRATGQKSVGKFEKNAGEWQPTRHWEDETRQQAQEYGDARAVKENLSLVGTRVERIDHTIGADNYFMVVYASEQPIGGLWVTLKSGSGHRYPISSESLYRYFKILGKDLA